jgi:hypothetical protein
LLPEVSLERLVSGIGGSVVALAAGLVLGGPAARALRGTRLHWSWAALAAALVLPARDALGGLAPAAFIAAVRASWSGRRWHREDLASGPEAARRARSRCTPLGVAGGLAQRVSRVGGAAAPRVHAGRLEIGRDERGRVASIAFATRRRGGPGGFGGPGGRHTLVVGATGSGKTVTQSAIAACAIANGFAAVVVDPKGDAGLRAVVRDAAAAAGRELVAWSPRGDSVYNPFARGSETEIADKVLASETFTEPHYLRQAQRYLGHAVRALRASGAEVSLRRMVEALDPPALEQLSRDLDRHTASAVQAYLDGLTGRQRSDLAGVRDRLAILAESDVGAWLDPGSRAAPSFDLLETVRMGAVVYFDLEADTRPLLTQMLGGAIVQDLLTTVAALQSRPAPALVVIDEFSAVAAEHVVRLFARARSAGSSLLLGTQELSDLRLPGRERLLDQVTGNLSTLIAHRQVVPQSADVVASLAGTSGGWRVTRMGDGRVARTRVREQVLDPTRVMRLGVGEAALIGLEGAARVQVARITPPPTHDRGGRTT